MSLQKKTILRYRELFPNETLKEISGRTGIQITRVHRLLGGKKMKVTELEAFEQVIARRISENPSFARLNHTVEKASSILTNEELGKISDYIERRVLSRSYGRLYISANETESYIA